MKGFGPPCPGNIISPIFCGPRGDIVAARRPIPRAGGARYMGFL
jgi:hypothetical protein